jgi:hypothetical protein
MAFTMNNFLAQNDSERVKVAPTANPCLLPPITRLSSLKPARKEWASSADDLERPLLAQQLSHHLALHAFFIAETIFVVAAASMLILAGPRNPKLAASTSA